MEDFSLFFFDFVQYFFRIFAFLCKIGVSHRSTELVLVTALRSFVDDLLRRCVANKMKSNTGNRYEISFSKNAKIDFSSIFNDLLIYLFFSSPPFSHFTVQMRIFATTTFYRQYHKYLNSIFLPIKILAASRTSQPNHHKNTLLTHTTAFYSAAIFIIIKIVKHYFSKENFFFTLE